MTDPLETICNLTGCSMETAEKVYDETKDVVEAVDKLLEIKESAANKYIQRKKRKLEETEEEKIIKPYRKILKEFDSILEGQLSHGGSTAKLDRHEETVQQNNCSQECQLPSLELKAETQETAYPSQSEYSSCLQSNDQTLPCSDHQSLQSCQDQGKE